MTHANRYATRSVVALMLTLPLAAGLLTGCSRMQRCVEYVDLPTSAARFEAAPLVVAGQVRPSDHLVEIDALYPVHRVTVQEVVKGGGVPRDIDVIAPSDQCTTSGERVRYLDGDPLDRRRHAVLYLQAEPTDGVYQLVSPQGTDAVGVVDDLRGVPDLR